MYDVMKRCFDIILALALLLIFSPLCFLLAIVIKFEDGGHILYFQERIGKKGKKFHIIKFRSMYECGVKSKLTNEQYNEYIKEFKLENDPRITGVGRFLRKYKIDEIPQLINVIFGHMSIVGPRPIVLEEIKYYDIYSRDKLLSVRPGLTGLWQISENYTYKNKKRQKIELFYVEHRNFFLDMIIIIRTVVLVIKKVINSLINHNVC